MSTWQSVDLATVGEDTEKTTVLTRIDGVSLFYPGRIHWLQGESESHKTWVALIAVAQVLLNGGTAVYVDFEDHPKEVKYRLVNLGVPRHILEDRSRFAYIRPDEPLGDEEWRDLWAEIHRVHPTFVVLDGVSEAMSIEDLDPMSTPDTARWIKLLPKSLAEGPSRPAVVVIDHQTKATEGRRGWAFGSQHKKAGLDGASYDVVALHKVHRAFGDDPVEGIISLTVAKDRLGYVRGHSPSGNAATIRITAWPDEGITFEVTSDAVAKDHGLRLQIARYLNGAPGSSARAVRGGAEGNALLVDQAVRQMVIDGDIRIEREGSKNAHYLTEQGGGKYVEQASAG